jgi:hypothetical protein
MQYCLVLPRSLHVVLVQSVSYGPHPGCGHPSPSSSASCSSPRPRNGRCVWPPRCPETHKSLRPMHGVKLNARLWDLSRGTCSHPALAQQIWAAEISVACGNIHIWDHHYTHSHRPRRREDPMNAMLTCALLGRSMMRSTPYPASLLQAVGWAGRGLKRTRVPGCRCSTRTPGAYTPCPFRFLRYELTADGNSYEQSTAGQPCNTLPSYALASLSPQHHSAVQRLSE